MKKFLLLIFIFSTFYKSLACSCVKGNFAQNYLEADFVALISIQETFGNSIYNRDGNEMNIYKAKINIEKVYKGKPPFELNIFGTTTYAYSGACEKLVKPTEKYLVLLNKNSNGSYFISSCSSMFGVDNPGENWLADKQKLFAFLDKNKTKLQGLEFVDYDDTSEDWDKITEKTTSEFTKTFGKKAVGKFGVYKVILNDNRKILDIIPLKKTGLNEKNVQMLMKKNLEIENYSLSKTKKEFLIYLKLY